MLLDTVRESNSEYSSLSLSLTGVCKIKGTNVSSLKYASEGNYKNNEFYNTEQKKVLNENDNVNNWYNPKI